MPHDNTAAQQRNNWAEQFMEHRARLLSLAERNLNPV